MSHYLSPGDYLPHDAPMLLLEEVVCVADETATCHVTVSANSVLAPFLDPDGNLPGWFALELMAQTIGVWSGWHRQQHGQASIALVCAAGVLPAGKRLSIHVKLLMQDARFGSFECVIQADNKTLTTGRVNTFQPATEEINTLFQQGAST